MRDQLIKQGDMTFLWEPLLRNFGEEKQLLVHTLARDYTTPKGLKYDERTDEDSPVFDDKTSSMYNTPTKCMALYNHVRNVTRQNKHTKNMLVMMGDDFAYQNAFSNF